MKIPQAKWGVCALALGFTMLRASPAPAQGNNKVAAEALFEDGRKLMSAGKADEACPKFADSQRLDPSLGTLLNLANCYEVAGKTASAWATFKEAASVATAANRANELGVAQKRAAALAPKLSKLTITVTTPVDGLAIQRDGSAVDRAEIGVPIPTDPGTHKIDVTAPGKKPWTSSVVVGKDAATQTLQIPALEDAPVTAPVASAPPVVAPPPVTNAPPPASAPTQAPPPPESHGSNGQRTGGFIVGGIGLVGIGLGAVFAVTAKSRYNDSLVNCNSAQKDLCNQAGLDKRNDARSAGNLATIGFGLGAAALVAGGVLVLTAGGDSSSGSAKNGVQLFASPFGLNAKGTF